MPRLQSVIYPGGKACQIRVLVRVTVISRLKAGFDEGEFSAFSKVAP